jgi:hypothetical protein
MRRRLLGAGKDVGKKVSGALIGQRDEGAPSAPSAQQTPPSPAAGDAVPEEPTAVTTTTDTVGPDSPASQAPAPEPADLDAVCAGAVEQAKQAAVEVAGTDVGDHLGVEPEDERVVTHSFASADPAYVGWRWAVTVARATDSDLVTVDEVVLLPGSDALLAPAWVPWSERVQPGDLSPGDLLPPPPDDPRLVPSYADVDAEPLPFELHRELGLGRPRVLSLDGRADAAERWYEGPAGPDTPLARSAPGPCATCGFWAPLAGALGRVFGACANGMSPEDGRVVAVTHGCGAHSETIVDTAESSFSGMAVEDDEFEVVAVTVAADADEAAETADVPEDSTVPGTDEPPLDDVVGDVEES